MDSPDDFRTLSSFKKSLDRTDTLADAGLPDFHISA